MSLTYANSARMAEYNTLKGDHLALIEKHKKLSINTQNLVDKVKAAEQAKKIAENRTTKAQAALKAAEFTISADTDELRDRMEKETSSKKKDMDKKNAGLLAVVKNNTTLFNRLQKKYDSTTADWARAHNLSKKLQQELQEANVQAGEFEARLQEETAKRIKLEKEAERIIPENIEISTLENKIAIVEKELEEALLVIEEKKVSFKEGIEREYNLKNKKWEKEISDMQSDMESREKVMDQVRAQRESSEEARIDLIKKYDLIERTIVISENKMNKVIGKVVSARNKITSLNASTPYRPGAVERTLDDVMKDLDSV